MMPLFAARLTLLLAAGVLCGLNAAERSALAERIGQAAADLRDLEALYRASTDRQERLAALELVLQRAAWLEQIGGMKDARADQLLALARLDGYEQSNPLRYGYLARESGSSAMELVLRRPEAAETPGRLEAFRKRLIFLSIRNVSSSVLELPGGVFCEWKPRFGELRREFARPAELPEDLRALAEFFALPARLAPGEEKACLVLLSETSDALESVGAAVSEEGQAPELVRYARVLLPERSAPEGMAAARKRAAEIEKQLQAEREKNPPVPARPVDPKAGVPPKPAPPAGEPKVLGIVERAGAGVLIQIRLNDGAVFAPNDVLVVRKDGKVTGKLRIPEAVVCQDDKRVYWVKIESGGRDDLAGGTIHAEP